MKFFGNNIKNVKFFPSIALICYPNEITNELEWNNYYINVSYINLQQHCWILDSVWSEGVGSFSITIIPGVNQRLIWVLVLTCYCF